MSTYLPFSINAKLVSSKNPALRAGESDSTSPNTAAVSSSWPCAWLCCCCCGWKGWKGIGADEGGYRGMVAVWSRTRTHR